MTKGVGTLSCRLLNAKKELGTLPDSAELQRLVKYYPTYGWEHRKVLLQGYFKDLPPSVLVDKKLEAKGIDKKSLSNSSIGAHTRWVKLKVEHVIIRILYLRYRLDDGLTRRQSNQKLLVEYGSEKPNTQDGGQSNLRKVTHSKILDEKNHKKPI